MKLQKISPLMMTILFGFTLLGCDAAFKSAENRNREASPTAVNADNSNSTDPTTTTNPNITNGVSSAFQLVQGDVAGIIDQIPKCNTVIGQNLVECLIIKDSFERDQVQQTSGPGFDWSRFIYDVQGANGERVTAEIYEQSDMGPTPDSISDIQPDLNRALWFSGRPGVSVHSIYLISKKISVENYNSVMIGFRYLPVDLETWSWSGESGPENVRLEVCNASLDECGVGDNVDFDALNSDAWHVYDVSNPGAGNGFNGHNHNLNDWRDGFAHIDLRQYSDEAKKDFVFRIAVTVDEGFSAFSGQSPILSSNMIDGVAVDNVIALASTETVDDTCTPPCDGDDCTPQTALLELNFGNPLMLGSFPVSSSNPFELELTNNGQAVATNIRYTGLVTEDFAFEGTTCGATIQPDETCFVTLSYNPQQSSLFDEDVFIIRYDDGENPDAVTTKTLQAIAVDL